MAGAFNPWRRPDQWQPKIGSTWSLQPSSRCWTSFRDKRRPLPRALFTSTSGAGHLIPLFPIADAARAAGWEITVADSAGGRDHCQHPGSAVRSSACRNSRRRPPTSRGDGEGGGTAWRGGEAYFLREIFGRLNTLGTLPTLQRLVEELDPAVIVGESSECSGGLIAEATSIPWFRVHPA